MSDMLQLVVTQPTKPKSSAVLRNFVLGWVRHDKLKHIGHSLVLYKNAFLIVYR